MKPAPYMQAACVLMLNAMFAGCDAKESASTQTAAPVLPVVAVKAFTQDVPDDRDYPGTTQSPEVVNIDARVRGYLDARYFDEGADVVQGQMLYLIQPEQYEAEVLRAEAEVLIATTDLEYAEKEAARNEPLALSGAISQQDWDRRTRSVQDAKGRLAAAEAGLVEARLKLSYCEIKSPINGRIGQSMVDPGNLVGPGSPSGSKLAQVVQLNPMRVLFQPAANEYPAYQRAFDAGPILARITVPQDRGEPLVYEGVVDLLNNTAQTDTSTFLARAVFASSGRLVLPSQYAAVRVRLRIIRAAVLVPNEALYEEPGTQYIWIVKPDDTAERRDIKTGAQYGPFTHIVSGLHADDPVIVKASPMLRKSGAKVKASIVDAKAFTQEKSHVSNPSAAPGEETSTRD